MVTGDKPAKKKWILEELRVIFWDFSGKALSLCLNVEENKSQERNKPIRKKQINEKE